MMGSSARTLREVAALGRRAEFLEASSDPSSSPPGSNRLVCREIEGYMDVHLSQPLQFVHTQPCD